MIFPYLESNFNSDSNFHLTPSMEETVDNVPNAHIEIGRHKTKKCVTIKYKKIILRKKKYHHITLYFDAVCKLEVYDTDYNAALKRIEVFAEFVEKEDMITVGYGRTLMTANFKSVTPVNVKNVADIKPANKSIKLANKASDSKQETAFSKFIKRILK